MPIKVVRTILKNNIWYCLYAYVLTRSVCIHFLWRQCMHPVLANYCYLSISSYLLYVHLCFNILFYDVVTLLKRSVTMPRLWTFVAQFITLQWILSLAMKNVLLLLNTDKNESDIARAASRMINNFCTLVWTLCNKCTFNTGAIFAHRQCSDV